jgi:hypothetical protein
MAAKPTTIDNRVRQRDLLGRVRSLNDMRGY